jgi:hypothetical protein
MAGAVQAAHTDNMTGAAKSTPTTVASAAPDSGPKSAMAVATCLDRLRNHFRTATPHAQQPGAQQLTASWRR